MVSAAKYQCTACGYIIIGQRDPEHGIPAGTPFEELPETWVCPVCGTKKDGFEKKDRVKL